MTEGLRIYNLFPTLAGSIADWTATLPRIAAMGFNAVYVNPFHYPGFSGSLYAVKDYYRLNPRFRGTTREARRRPAARLYRGGRGARAARDHGPRRQPHLQGQRAGRAPAAMVRPRRERRDASPFAVDPDDPATQDRVGRPGRARLPAAAARRDRRLFRGAGAPLRRARLRRLSLRRRLQGAGRGVAPADRRRQGGATRDACSAPRISGRARRRCWRSPMPASTICSTASNGGISRARGCSSSTRSSAISRRRSAFPESHDTERLVTELLAAGFPEDQIEARYRQAYALSAGVFDRRDDADGVRIRLGAAHLGGAERRRGRPSRSASTSALYRRGQRDESGGPGAQRGGAAAPAAEPPDDPLLVLLRQTESGDDRALIVVNTRSAGRATWSCRSYCRRPSLPSTTDWCSTMPAGGERAGTGALPSRRSRSASCMRRRGRCGTCRSRRARMSAATRASPEWRPDARILIEEVYPEIDGGRYPVKRIVGESSRSGPICSATATTRSRAVAQIPPRGRGVAGDAVRASSTTTAGSARFRPDRVGLLALHDRGLDRPICELARGGRQEARAGQDIALELVEGGRSSRRRCRHAGAERRRGGSARCCASIRARPMPTVGPS